MKYKCPGTFTFQAFHPKALNMVLWRQVFWLALPTAFPYAVRTVADWLGISTFVGAYSYGDSTGLKPVSLLIPG